VKSRKKRKVRHFRQISKTFSPQNSSNVGSVESPSTLVDLSLLWVRRLYAPENTLIRDGDSSSGGGYQMITVGIVPGELSQSYAKGDHARHYLVNSRLKFELCNSGFKCRLLV
jgi:hypothetical protein